MSFDNRLFNYNYPHLKVKYYATVKNNNTVYSIICIQ